MARERRNQLVLAALAMVFAAVAYQQWPTTVEAPPASNDMQGAVRASTGKPPMTAPEVHLEALRDDRPKPGEVERNLFRFKPKPAPPAPASTVERVPPVTTASAGPPATAAVPPIALKFITLVERPERGEKIALLSDGRGGPPIYGKEGDVIEGRYKIVRIGAESIEVAYLDGRGRQTIRLTGQ